MAVDAPPPRPPPARPRLVEGRAGPFYVALSAPTFVLIVAVYAVGSVVLALLFHDHGRPARLALAVGIPVEAGFFLHTYGRKIARWGRRRTLLWHGAVLLLVIPFLVLALR